MKRKLVSIIAIMLAAGMIFVGCGDASGSSGGEYSTESSSYDGGGFDADVGSYYAESDEIALEESASVNGAKSSAKDVEAPTEGYSEGNEPEAESSYDTSRKIVYTSYIDIETKNFDEDIDSIKKLVNSNGGYYSNSSIAGTAEYGGRNASYTARIPAKNYQTFMESLGDIGSVTSSSEYVDDITSSYVDVQARLKSLNTKLKRLQEFEQNATNVEELLQIEDRINNVQYDIESYTAQLKLYDDKVDYCTVTIDIDEVVTYSEVKKDTAWNRFSEAFFNSIAGFLAFLQAAVIAIIYILPYAIVAGVIAIIVWFATKKQRAERKLKKQQQKPIIQSGTYTGPVYEEQEATPEDTKDEK